MRASDAANPSDAKPTGSRRERKKVRTRREIFEAAMDLFAARDFDAVTVEQVCAAADVAKGTFFLHFSSKAALLSEWNRELAAELAGRLHEPRGSSLSEYRMLVEQLGDQWLRRPDATRALLRELLAPRTPARPETDLHAVIEAVVRRGQERGELRRNVSPRLAAVAFLATCAAVFSAADDREDRTAPQQGGRLESRPTRSEPKASEGGPLHEQVRSDLLHALLHGVHEPKPRLKWKPS